MRRTRGQSAFTLPEMLVAIGLVALLLGVLLPVLSKARAAARQTACLSNLRQLSVAQHAYAAEYAGAAVPVLQGSERARRLWVDNDAFRRALGVARVGDRPGLRGRFPTSLLCPDALRTQNESRDGTAPVAFAFGYNATQLPRVPADAAWADVQHLGVKVARVRGAAAKYLFMDAMDWHVYRWASDGLYFQQGYGEARSLPGANGYNAYRHGGGPRRGLNVAFWDGHAEHLRYEQVAAATGEAPTAAPWFANR